jgi:PAS domain S-box-containing protein
MLLQFPLSVVLLSVTATFCAGTAFFVWHNFLRGSTDSRFARTNQAQMTVLSLLSLWSVGQIVAVSTTTYWPKLLGMSLTLGVTLWTSMAWLVFALLYTGRSQWVTSKTLVALAVLPTIGTVATATNSIHGLMFVDPTLVQDGSRWVLDFEWGPGTWLVAVHDWTLCGIGLRLLFQKFLTSRNVYRKISFFHVVGGTVLNVGAFVSLMGWSPFEYLVLGTATFSVLIVATGPTVVSYRYLKLIPLERILSVLGRRFRNLAPMARDTIIQNMQSGVIVADHDNRIVDLNPLGRKMIAAEDRRVVGKKLTDVVPPSLFKTDDTSFLEPETTEGRYQGVWVETPTGDQHCFDVHVTSLGPDDDPVGRVAIINDVTDREIRKEKLEQRTNELERQNEQLDQFAGIVSHDLRNPLTVAEGYLETAAELEDNHDHVEEAQYSLERMEAIIDDVLTLAREGRSIGETETVSLASIAREAWDNVETERASLVVDGDIEFGADPDRLLNLFENLFRNARDHAGPSVTVTVGAEDDLFYVADDGPGIPPEEREAVLEFGYTTAEAGSGFGLAIVRQVADAHGWSIELTEADGGGTRFEFGRVERHDAAMYG